MRLDPDVCYRALRTRDRRFDGRFFTGVRSTGIYCRPICPARPRRENCTFFACAAAAQEAGYRPCLRCRPEASPGTPAWLGTSATVTRGLRLIGEGALDTGSVGQLAGRLGVGDRHLRRLFVEHLGASPLAVAQNRRILFAKKLLDETTLPLAQVAFSAGFSSVRRFNDTLRRTYACAPRELRRRSRQRTPSGDDSELTLKLAYRPPLHWPALAGFLAARAIPGVESVSRTAYCRSIRIDGVRGILEVRPGEGDDHLRVRIRLSDTQALIQVAERVRHLFDLGADPTEIAAHLRLDPILRGSVRRRCGLRVPGAWDGFEFAVRAILGQQVSVAAASRLAGRLVETYGEPLDGACAAAECDPELRFFFPRPDALADADAARLGVPRTRAKAIAALSRAVADKKITLAATAEPEETKRAIQALPGLGPWTAEVIAMRVLRAPDAFPASDLGLRRALSPGPSLVPSREVSARAEPWRPWRAYAAMHLWQNLDPRPSQEGRSSSRTRTL